MFRLYSYLKFNYEETLLVPHKPDLSHKMPFLTRRRKYKPASQHKQKMKSLEREKAS
jgi:hypothetical protein